MMSIQMLNSEAGLNIKGSTCFMAVLLVIFTWSLVSAQSEITGTLRESDFLKITDDDKKIQKSGVKKKNIYRYEIFDTLEVNSTLDALFIINIVVNEKNNDQVQIITDCDTFAEDFYTIDRRGRILLISSELPIETPVQIEIITSKMDSIKLIGKNNVTLSGVVCKKFEGYLSGESCLRISGVSETAYFDVKNNSQLYAEQFKTGKLIIYAKGHSQSIVYPENVLKAVSYERAIINYINQPKTLVKKIVSFGFISYGPLDHFGN